MISERRLSDLTRLRGLMPLRHLGDAEFDNLTRHADIETRDPERELFRCGPDDDWLFYLLEGDLRVLDAQSESFQISAGTLEALHPLSPHPKARVQATAVSAVRFVRFPASLLQSQRKPKGGIQVKEAAVGEDELDNELLFAVYQALRDETLVLPTLPDVALRIRTAASDPSKGAEDVANIILTDPALASYCIRVANSAGYGGSTPISDVRSAVMRMGINPTRDFIMAHVVRNLFKTKDPRCTTLMRAAWSHSANIASLCFVLARRLTKVNAEQALLTGLLHDIGVMALVSQLDAFPGLFRSEVTLNTVLHDLRYEVSAMVLRAWRLPEEMVRASCAAEQWFRPAESPYGMTEILQLAHWHDPEHHVPWAEPLPDDDAPVLRALPLDAFTASGRLLVVREAGNELEKLRAILHA